MVLRTKKELLVLEYMDRGYSHVSDSCFTYKERTASVGIYGQRLRGYMSLTSHPYSDLLGIPRQGSLHISACIYTFRPQALSAVEDQFWLD